MMVLTYTETMTMPAVVFDALMYALTIKQRVRKERPAETTPPVS